MAKKAPNINQLSELQKRMAQFEKSIDSFTGAVNKLTGQFEANAQAAEKAATEATKAAEQRANAEKEAADISQKYLKNLKEAADQGKKIAELTAKRGDRERAIMESLKDQFDNQEDLERTAKNIAQSEIDQAKNMHKILKLENDRLSLSKDQLKADEKRAKLQEKANDLISESLGFVDSIANTIEEIPVVGGILNQALGLDTLKRDLAETLSKNLFKDVSENSEDIDTNLDGAADSTKLMKGNLLRTLGITAALAAVAFTIKKAFDIEQEITTFSREMGLTREEAFDTHHELLGIAATTKIVGANQEEVNKAFKELSSIAGTNANISRDAIESQILLTKQYGMTTEQAEAFQMSSAASGKTAYQLLGNTQSMVAEYNALTGDSLNYREITKDIAGVSKTTFATYKGNTKQLTLAVIQAKKLGLSMEETAQISKSLLDVESSLEAEMKANVLTGKSVNMNRARGLALQGKTAEAAAETFKQIGSYEEFLNMAPYQQESLAAAAGMTVEQISKAGQLQQVQSKITGRQIKSLNDLSAAELDRLVTSKDLTEEQAKQIVQENQNASTQEKIALIVDRLSASMDWMLSYVVNPLVTAFEYLAPIITGIATTIAVTMLPALGAAAIEAGALAVGAIGAAIGASAGFAAAGIIAGLAVAIGGFYALKSAGDLSIDQNGGPVVMSPRENTIFQGTANDELAMAPGILNTLSQPAEPVMTPGILNTLAQPAVSNAQSMTAVDNVGIESLLREQNSLLSQLLQATNQPVKINIGNKAIEEIDRVSTLRKTYSTKVDNAYGTFG
jgi:hypothetical protein